MYDAGTVKFAYHGSYATAKVGGEDVPDLLAVDVFHCYLKVLYVVDDGCGHAPAS